jgi:hypothetical protein
MRHSFLTLPAFALGLLAAGLSGCAGFGTSKSGLDAELSKASGAAAASVQTAKFDVVFQPKSGKPEHIERSLSEPLTVQQALEQSGGLKKFRRVEIELVRQLPSGGVHTIPCEFDRSTRRINPEFDYALMPGDKVVVKEDSSTIIDDMLQSAGGGLGRRFNMKGQSKSGGRYRLEG